MVRLNLSAVRRFEERIVSNGLPRWKKLVRSELHAKQNGTRVISRRRTAIVTLIDPRGRFAFVHVLSRRTSGGDAAKAVIPREISPAASGSMKKILLFSIFLPDIQAKWDARLKFVPRAPWSAYHRYVLLPCIRARDFLFSFVFFLIIMATCQNLRIYERMHSPLSRGFLIFWCLTMPERKYLAAKASFRFFCARSRICRPKIKGGSARPQTLFAQSSKNCSKRNAVSFPRRPTNRS